MKKITNVLSWLAIILLLPFTINGFFYEDYHWREYNGNIPDDAFPGGTDASGKPIYIGQVYYANKLLPAKIYENDPNAYIAWGSEMKILKNIKILCTANPEKFVWVQTTKTEIHKLVNHKLVKGGWEPSYDQYIGRAFYQFQTLVGRVKVSGRPNLNLGLHITSDGKQSIVDNFEILSYVSSQNTTDIRYCSKRILITK